MLFFYLLICLFIYSPSNLWGQQPIRNSQNQAIWASINTQFHLSKQFYIGNEFNLRRVHWGGAPEQVIERPSVNYIAHKFVVLSLGYSFIVNDPYGEFPAPKTTLEHNIWEQIAFKHPLKKWTFTHRYRFEHRWVEQLTASSKQATPTDNFAFRQRLRYRFILKYTLKSFGKNQQLYIAFFDELFINLPPFGSTILLFNQNWLYGGIGYNFSKTTQIELGYMNQWMQRNEQWFEQNHNIQIVFRYTLPIYKWYTKKQAQTNT